MLVKRKIEHAKLEHNWKKRSSFFQLPYWKTLILHHNLDVMHIEKNICDSIVGTLFSIDDKSNENMNDCLDLQAMGIRDQLHLIERGNRVILPTAYYSLTSNEKKKFCKFFKEVKVPDGYASNISWCIQVNERKIFGLKSHDCHVPMQQLLPLVIHGVLHKNVCAAIVKFCSFFKQLCSKVLKIDQLEHFQNDIIVKLCKLKRIFPPSFFDVLVHLPVHLENKAKVIGPVQYQWMYPIERYVLIQLNIYIYIY